MYKIVIRSITFSAFIFALAACGGDDEPTVSDADLVFTEAAIIAAESSAKTATAIALLPTDVPLEPTATVTLIVPTSEDGGDEENSATLTPLPTVEIPPTPVPFFTSTPPPDGTTPCFRASFEYETFPDGTRIPRNKPFVKLWRIKNSGSCTWTSAFSVIFVKGELMGADASIPLTDVDIPPGGYAEISVDMVAPSKVGFYKGYWMLLSPDGNIFGVGINGTEWFWIDIEIFDPEWE